MWVCICSLSYRACNAHSPFCHLWSVRLYKMFPPYLIHGTIFRKKVIGHIMCVLIFSTVFVWNIYHSKRNSARYCHTCTLLFIERTRYSSNILIKIQNFFSQVFKKFSKFRFDENNSIGIQVIQCGRTGTCDRDSSCFSRFCERNWKELINYYDPM